MSHRADSDVDMGDGCGGDDDFMTLMKGRDEGFSGGGGEILSKSVEQGVIV